MYKSHGTGDPKKASVIGVRTGERVEDKAASSTPDLNYNLAGTRTPDLTGTTDLTRMTEKSANLMVGVTESLTVPASTSCPWRIFLCSKEGGVK